ncbi:NADPH:quinone reductase [Novipirellula artificiosorum]|uniref:Zinc-type alcohol dehydrogenase-like protein n=1 Tax=Novipirellula artificiosorum TaxID=2528016 RepID=A0A5C6DZP7_9BACT|nr:NADPH:quinone reductase [Novipirellula artificiosorum]TWU41925.1 Zinc-type alcohol dehydrogenase-like protein [Novipirellula artificiosorum]
MKAAFIESTGDPAVIQFGELPEPELNGHDVLIRVHAVAVNPIDTYIRSGVISFDSPKPYIIGCDAAGVVEQVGNRVTGVSVGDRVWCTNQGLLGRQGTFAERIAVDAAWCYPLPDNVSYDDAAASSLVGVTAHLGLFREADLQAGETILVIGGTGGVGSMVVQIARIAGARVITTAGSDEKCHIARMLGADVVINYKQESIQEAVRREVPKGVNVFWETRRQPDFDAAVEMLAPRGRMVIMAGREARPEFPVGPFYVKECSLHGFAMFKATHTELRAAAEDLNRWMAANKLTANISKTLSLDEAAESHRLQEASTLGGDGQLSGKIVLRV